MRQIMEKAINPNTPSIEYDNICTECGSDNIGCGDNYNICLDCKANLGNDIDYRADWRNESNGEDMSRCNIARNELLPESSMSTCIGSSKNSKLTQELKRSLIWNSVPHGERSMRNKIEEIAIVCRQHGIPHVIVEYAQENYHKVIKKLESHGRTRKRGNNDKGLKAAVLFISFQDSHKPKTYQEVAKYFDIDPRHVSAGINLFNELVRPRCSKITKYSDYIDEFCDSLNMTDDHKNRVAEVADKADKLGILENNIPTSMIAGCISYVIAEFGLPIKSSDIRDRCNVSIPTINKVCEKLNKRSVDLLHGTDDDPPYN